MKKFALCSVTVFSVGIQCPIYIYIFTSYRAVNTVSVIRTSQLILYREIIAVCSQIHTKHINTLCGQNVELLMVVHIVTTGLSIVNFLCEVRTDFNVSYI